MKVASQPHCGSTAKDGPVPIGDLPMPKSEGSTATWKRSHVVLGSTAGFPRDANVN
jgi:hypothetical protein